MTTDELSELRRVLSRVPTRVLVWVRVAGRVYFRLRPAAAGDAAVSANLALVDGLLVERRALGR